jgi:dipeptidyl aminopeptidase/acylaminoacyl peptidase
MQNPEMMLFHYRETFAATMRLYGDSIEKLNTKTPETMSSLTYPSWHPSGKFVAFSVNNIKQSFHTTDPNRIEVFDHASDVVVYDVNRHEIITAPELFAKDVFETFPTFSPDGKTLYFCSADSVAMPHNYTEVKYSLCAVSFDPELRCFGTQVDTLYNAKKMKKSVSFPRVSPDGRFLMFTLAGYGNFSIWHRDADLYMLNLNSLTFTPLDAINSPDTESYHSWSSNSRWVVFSSRRMDGLYTRLYIAHVDEQGQVSKPFLLPQKERSFYGRLMKSYNVPEFITGKVRKNSYDFSRKAIKGEEIQVSFQIKN